MTINLDKHQSVIISPDFFKEYLTQNVILHVKSHVTRIENY